MEITLLRTSIMGLGQIEHPMRLDKTGKSVPDIYRAGKVKVLNVKKRGDVTDVPEPVALRFVELGSALMGAHKSIPDIV